MAYTVNVTGHPGSQADDIVYSGYHNIIDNSSNYITAIRNVIPKYSKITKVVARVPEFEKGYSWGSAKYWFADQSGNRIGKENKLSNYTNTNLSTDVTFYFQSETAQAGQFNTSKATGLRIYFKDTVPVDFVTRDPRLEYTYDKPIYILELALQETGTAYSHTGTSAKIYLNGSQCKWSSFGTLPNIQQRYEINTTNTTVTLSETHEPWENFLGWYSNGQCISTESTYNFTFGQNSITSYSPTSHSSYSGEYANITIIAKYEKIKYPIVAKDYNGTLIQEGYTYWGEKIASTFYPANPVRQPDNNFHYQSNDYLPSPRDTYYYGDVSEIIAQYIATPHSMSYALTTEGRRHHTCSGCEYNYFERPYDLCQENLFHFSDWVESDCKNMNQGSNSYDILNGTITITGNGDCYTMYGGGNNYYHIPITPGEEYIFKYNVLTTGTKQAFVFFYNSNGSAVNGVGISQPHIGKYDGQPIIFIAPEGATQLAIRVGVRDASTATFSNLIVCKTKHLRSLNETTSLIRRVYFADQAVSAIGNASSLTLTNAKRKGFDFNGWYNDENFSSLLSLPINLNSSKTIYPKWFERLGILGDKTIKIFNGTQQAKIFLGDQKLF